ncbi:MAG: hypothetical protein AB1938_32855, partial [Myxococcota bacterium]
TGGGSGGGSGGGATGGGSGGGATGGGSGGGATGGGAGGGAGGGSATCNYMTQDCSSGTCVVANNMGTAFACLPGQCNLSRQDCDGGACVLGQQGSSIITACQPNGTRQVGETCGQTIGGCVAGSLCAGPQGGTATCIKMCFGNPGDCPSGYACTGGVQVSTSVFLLTCEVQCDLLQQNCPNQLACYPSSQGNVCFTAGAGGAGASCTSADNCQRGFGCFSMGGSGACRAFCNLDGGSPGCTTPLADGGTNMCLAAGSVGACLE